jgi:hypothetical protein
MKKITISDVTLRDGNHVVGHSINENVIKEYCKFAEKAKLTVVEVGHGNGLGASSLAIGRSAISDKKVFAIIVNHNLQESSSDVAIDALKVLNSWGINGITRGGSAAGGFGLVDQTFWRCCARCPLMVSSALGQ